MIQAYIGLGSNLGDGRENLCKAWQQLGNIPGIILGEISRPFDSKPLDMESEHRFTNAVGCLQTDLLPQELLSQLLEVEKKLGRDRSKGKDRTVDLDLLLYGERILEMPGLTVPHPEMVNRLFVLAPLAELAPELVHPRIKKTMTRLLDEFQSDDQDIFPMTWNIGENQSCRSRR